MTSDHKSKADDQAAVSERAQLLSELDRAHPVVSIALGGKPTLYSRAAAEIRDLERKLAERNATGRTE